METKVLDSPLYRRFDIDCRHQIYYAIQKLMILKVELNARSKRKKNSVLMINFVAYPTVKFKVYLNIFNILLNVKTSFVIQKYLFELV